MSMGEMSAPEIRALAILAYEDQVQLLTSVGLSGDLAHSDLYHLAKLGSWGDTTRIFKKD